MNYTTTVNDPKISRITVICSNVDSKTERTYWGSGGT